MDLQRKRLLKSTSRSYLEPNPDACSSKANFRRDRFVGTTGRVERSCSQMHMDLAKEISVGVQATPLRPDMAALREEFSRSCSKIYDGLEEEASLTVDVARTSKSMSVNEDPTANDRLLADVLQGTSGGAKDMEA
ncbi:hypothetical protein MHU86_21765 [Fragilaria crotonensis]|nr:hypothetical protein MHU86_21765 [Fragilaria crotonensis]